MGSLRIDEEATNCLMKRSGSAVSNRGATTTAFGGLISLPTRGILFEDQVDEVYRRADKCQALQKNVDIECPPKDSLPIPNANGCTSNRKLSMSNGTKFVFAVRSFSVFHRTRKCVD